MHVDALDRAAALAGVVHRAVGERLGRDLRVGVVGDVGRILAAELELQPDHARADRRGDARPGGVAEPVKNTPSTGCSISAAPISPPPTSGDEHVRRHAGGMQQPVDVQAGQGGELGRLVEHGVAGEQRRHEHVAADEVRIVPGRDVGDDAERLLGDALAHAGVGEDLLVGDSRFDLGEEEIDSAEEAVQLVARLLQGLAHLGRERGGERLELGDHDRRERRRSPPCARPAAAPPTPAARRGRAPPWRRRSRRRRPAARRSARRWQGW